MVKIGIFEDHPIVLNSIVTLIESQKRFNVAFAAKSKKDLFDKLKGNAQPNIVIVDMISADVFGLEVFEHLYKNYPLIKVIAFTTLSSPVLVENFLSVGVKGYVNKNQEQEDLITAIDIVVAGEIYLPNDYNFLSKKYTKPNNTMLTEREVEIVILIGREFTTNDIAEQLKITTNTVENHRKKIFEKLNVKNVAGMMREAAKLGYL